MTEESSPMAMPVAITPGRSSAAPPAITAGGVTSTAAMIIAMTSPDDPANRRPVARLSKMYAAQQPADTRAKITPATCAPCPPAPRGRVHPPPRRRHRHGQRPQELDRDRDPQWYPRKRLVDRVVHHPENDP